MNIRKLIKEYGEPYSKMLGIDLHKGESAYSKWFLAAILYARPIREESATKTYREFEIARMTDPSSIVDAGLGRIIAVLDKGGYARYDFRTANQLINIFGQLLKNYAGSLKQLYESSTDSNDLERRLMELGKGMGPTTISIFLRDMQEVWPKAKPKPTNRIKKAASELGINDIGTFASEQHLSPVELATALHRYARTKKRASL